MSEPCTVLIAARELLEVLKARMTETADATEILAFTDGDALRALEAITARKPAIIALERIFAATPRGAALINRIKADPSLVDLEIRVVSRDADDRRIAARRSPPPPAHSGGGTAIATAAAEVAAPVRPLDHYGTRRAPRFKVAGEVEVVIDGNAATLVDLSTVGAQVLTTSILKPNQRIRMALPEESGAIRFNAAVAWAKFEIPAQSGPRYRAGIEFLDANTTAVETYCERHKS